MSNVSAINCIDDLKLKIEEASGLPPARVLHVYSEEELIERLKGLAFPCVAVVYDGLLAVQEQGATGKTGGSADLIVSVMLFFKQQTRASEDPKEEMIALLDTIRGKILGSRSPTGHLWKFKAEVSAKGKSGLLAYVQRWGTPAQLV